MPELSFSLATVLGFALCLSVGAFLRGLAGFGMALVAMPFLVLLVPPADAVIAVLVVQITLTLIDLRECIAHADRRAVFMLMLAAAFGTPIGLLFIALVPLFVAQIVIGAITAAAAVAIFFSFSLGRHPGAVATTAVGFFAGLFSGLAAAPGPPVVAYFLAREVPARVKRASMIVLFAILAVFALITAEVQGTLDLNVVLLGLASAPLCAAGSALGAYCFRRGSEASYRLVALAAMMVSALFALVLGLLTWWQL
ncbi:sulfite exporter TauE/SafE family protein [Martelella limonii]|uniref:sulfite exporter TauE/SafE family protein n=1 Tax=Martelella limonii TaxID=1647649 RepID=UPI001580722F|nr:sulfite exporter TauE/SafE family protein [Martelella limonii]